MTSRKTDIDTLPALLTALRLPSFHKLWAQCATRADTEGWPAAHSRAVVAEYRRAKRDMLRNQRHLNEAQLPAGNLLAPFDLKALPALPPARTEAFASGDWLEGGGNLIAIGNSGSGKTLFLCAIGLAQIEAGHRVFYTRISDLVPRLHAAAAISVLKRLWPNSTSSA